MRTSYVLAPGNVDRINAPAFAGAAVIAGHSPAQSMCGMPRQVDDRCDKALRIAAPCLTTGNRTGPISSDSTIVAAHNKAAAGGENVLKCISTVSAELKHTTVEPDSGIDLRGFKIEIVLKCQLATTAGKKINRQ